MNARQKRGAPAAKPRTARRCAPATRGKPSLAVPAVAAALFLHAASAGAEQVWYGQSVSVHASEAVRLSFSNTVYTEHGKHFANEEAGSFRVALGKDSGWSAGAGITFGQDRVELVAEEPGGDRKSRRHWVWSSRPTEHVALDWSGGRGGWSFFHACHFDLYFRKGERDWPLYRDIATVTAPPVPGLPWSPRPYFTEQIYFSGRECFSGLDRFNQFRVGAGVRLHPCENMALSFYWQYRDIEQEDGEWEQFRVAGASAALAF